MELFPKPKNPRIWVAARGGPGFKRVAELGDGWFPANFSPVEVADGIRKIRAEKSKLNMKQEFDVACMNYICLAEDQAKAIEISRQTLIPRVSGGSFGRAKSIEDAFQNRCFLGNAREIADQIEKFRSAGVQNQVFTMLFGGGLDKVHSDMKILGRDVFPSFR